MQEPFNILLVKLSCSLQGNFIAIEQFKDWLANTDAIKLLSKIDSWQLLGPLGDRAYYGAHPTRTLNLHKEEGKRHIFLKITRTIFETLKIPFIVILEPMAGIFSELQKLISQPFLYPKSKSAFWVPFLRVCNETIEGGDHFRD